MKYSVVSLTAKFAKVCKCCLHSAHKLAGIIANVRPYYYLYTQSKNLQVIVELHHSGVESDDTIRQNGVKVILCKKINIDEYCIISVSLNIRNMSIAEDI